MQSTPQISDFQKIKRQKISWLCLILINTKVQSSFKWLSGRHTETNALRDELKDNCKEDYDSAAHWK